MARRLVEAQYEYNWNPLVGSLVGALRAIGREVDSAVVCALSGVAGAPPPVPTEPVEGVWFEPQPDPLELPDSLAAGLRALGVGIEVTRRDEPPAGLSWRLLRRRLRGDLAAGRPIVAAGAGLDPFGPTFGLIVGFDDDRRAWRRDGQMTDQVGPWLPYDELQSSVPLVIIRIEAVEPAVESAVESAGEPEGAAALRDTAAIAAAAAAATASASVAGVARWISILAGDDPIEPQGHARAAQTFAAARGEAATFWRGCAPGGAEAARAQAVAISLSRFATLFPYPMGGAPNSRGVRSAGAAILRDALAQMER